MTRTMSLDHAVAGTDTMARWRTYFPELGDPEEIDELVRRTSGRTLHELEAGLRPVVGGRPRVSAEALAEAATSHTSVIASLAAALASAFADDVQEAIGPARGLVETDMEIGLSQQLASAIVRKLTGPLATELHRRRTSGLLVGDDGAQRYRYFHREVMSADGLAELFDQYPRLGADVTGMAQRFVAHLRTTMTDYARRRTDLQSAFGISSDARLVEVQLGAGDRHRGGRTVTVLRHSDGAQVVYKPRDARMDIAFTRVLQWCNARFGTDYPSMTYVDDDECSFVEFLPSPRLDEAALPDYYRVAGGLLALLHTLNGCDVHFENLRTIRDRPVIVDLETVLHPEPLAEASLSADFCPASALTAVRGSVSRIGLLPNTLQSTDGQSSIDVGGIGYRPGATSPRRVHTVVDDGTDRMRMAFEHVTFDTLSEVPTMATGATAENLIPAFVEGFRAQYGLLLAERAEYRDLVRSLFAGQTVRYINNETLFYAQLMQMGGHPDLSGDPMSREVLMHRVALRNRQLDGAVHRAEIDDLLADDIPYLTVSTTDTRLRDSSGRAVGVDFPATPLDGVIAKIDALGEEDMDRQVRIIATSLLDKREVDPVQTGLIYSADTRAQHRSAGRAATYLSTATEIGEFLCSTMFASDGEDVPSDWICAVPADIADAAGWRSQTLGLDVFDGRPGIAAALAALARCTGRADFADAARSVAYPLSRVLGAQHRLRPHLAASSGAYCGQAAAIWSLHRIGRDLGEGALVDSAYAHVGSLDEITAGAGEHDVISGVAGTLAVAVKMWQAARHHADRERCRRPIARAIGHLHEVQETGHVAGRRDPRARSGYAHGAAGFYPWLFAAAELVDDPDLIGSARSTAERFVEHERSFYDGTERDWWRDELREVRSYGWCHGAPGILLAKVLTVEARPDLAEDHADEIERAAELTREHGFGHNPTYCHGDIGNLEILGHYAHVTGDRDTAKAVDAAFGRLHDAHLVSILHNTSSRYALTNGLMTGLAGVAMALARASAPGEMDPVLW